MTRNAMVSWYKNRVDVRGRKYVLGPTQAHLSPSRRRELKWALRRAKNISTPKNIHSITIIIISESIFFASKCLKEKWALPRCKNLRNARMKWNKGNKTFWTTAYNITIDNIQRKSVLSSFEKYIFSMSNLEKYTTYIKTPYLYLYKCRMISYGDHFPILHCPFAKIHFLRIHFAKYCRKFPQQHRKVLLKYETRKR